MAASGAKVCNLSKERTVLERKPTWQFKIGPVVVAALCVIWFVRVWRGDNPTDTTVLIILALITMASTVYGAAMIKKNGS